MLNVQGVAEFWQKQPSLAGLAGGPSDARCIRSARQGIKMRRFIRWRWLILLVMAAVAAIYYRMSPQWQDSDGPARAAMMFFGLFVIVAVGTAIEASTSKKK